MRVQIICSDRKTEKTVILCDLLMNIDVEPEAANTWAVTSLAQLTNLTYDDDYIHNKANLPSLRSVVLVRMPSLEHDWDILAKVLNDTHNADPEDIADMGAKVAEGIEITLSEGLTPAEALAMAEKIEATGAKVRIV